MVMAAGAGDIEVRQFAERLTSEQRMLVVLKRELYEGSWQAMAESLAACSAEK